MCKTFGITLSPSKTRVGMRSATFYGHHVDAEGHTQTDANLNPIAKMAPPENRKELRSALGMLVQGMKRFPAKGGNHYAIVAKPLNQLLGSKTWDWTPTCQRAWETIRQTLLDKPVCCAPDYGKPFFLDSDASEDGHGCVLYQLDGTRCRIIRWFSKAWSSNMRKMPIYYQEAAALFWAISKCKYYAETPARRR